MADVGQVLATGGTTIVAGAVGAGLTYLFATLNRRHQEEREDRTRWYEARFRAYEELSSAANLIVRSGLRSEEQFQTFSRAAASVELVGSEEAVNACVMMLAALLPFYEEGGRWDEPRLKDALERFNAAAREDLGQPALI
jgi:hypothetical protein